jgi:hypothetical protein
MKAVGMGYARDGPDRDVDQAPTITISIKYSRFAALLRWEKQRNRNFSPRVGGRSPRALPKSERRMARGAAAAGLS